MTARPEIVACQGGGCDATIRQQRIGSPRRFCDTCRETRQRAAEKAWKHANPDKQTRYQRERRQRRRYDTTPRRTA